MISDETAAQIDEQSIVIATTDSVTPPGQGFWLDDDMFPIDERTGMHYPSFAVQEVAKIFFGREADWLRWRMRPDKPNKKGAQNYPLGCFLLDGEPMEFKRKPVVYEWFEDAEGNEIAASVVKKMSDKKKESLTKQREIDYEADSTARYYTLADIERMAHALAQQGIIDGTRVALIVVMVRCCARLYGVAI